MARWEDARVAAAGREDEGGGCGRGFWVVTAGIGVGAVRIGGGTVAIGGGCSRGFWVVAAAIGGGVVGSK